MEKEHSVNWTRIAEAAAVAVPMVGTLLIVTREAVQAWGRARASGVRILQVGKTEARKIRFPPGHPREGVLHIGHPALADVYYTMADFHRVAFEHKFCEAIELLMHLGASNIRVEHVRGWSQEFSARLSVPLGPTESLSAETGRQGSKTEQLLYEATLTGAKKGTLPEKMVWCSHEPTWQSIANGRIKFGLHDFSLTVSYEDDFGVNASFKTTVLKAGLDLGGRFEDHVATVWRISGKFRAA